MKKLMLTALAYLTAMRPGDAGTTQIADVIVPEVFNPYVQQITEEKSRLIASGAVARDSLLDAELAGGGLTFHVPSFKDLANDEENISTDSAPAFDGTGHSTPKKIGTSQEVAVRLSRNQSWASMDLTADLAGVDPMSAIGQRVGAYRARRLQAAFIASMKGVFADNDLDPTGAEHVKGDLTFDISGAPGTTSSTTTQFNTKGFLDAAVTMGDSQDDLGMMMVHSIVYNRMQKNNLIQFIPDANGQVNIPTFLGRIVIVDDGMPSSAGVYQSWLFGTGAVRLGMADPKTPTETKRDASAGNGGGGETLFNRWEWCLHPVGHKFSATATKGGPSNAATSGNLAHADSWTRAYTERKQIKIARFITREY